MTARLVAIEVDAGSAGPIFRFTSLPGPARILTLGVTEADIDEPAWEIMAADWAARPTYAGTAQIIVESQEAMAPLEPGSDIGGEAWDLLASLGENREVSSVTYGEVPAGFQQTHPQHGPPPPLQPGARYKVAVMGACLGQAVFTV